MPDNFLTTTLHIHYLDCCFFQSEVARGAGANPSSHRCFKYPMYYKFITFPKKKEDTTINILSCCKLKHCSDNQKCTLHNNYWLGFDALTLHVWQKQVQCQCSTKGLFWTKKGQLLLQNKNEYIRVIHYCTILFISEVALNEFMCTAGIQQG